MLLFNILDVFEILVFFPYFEGFSLLFTPFLHPDI